MSATTLRNEDIRALDQTRQRLLQLTTAIQTLQSGLLQTEPLPPWSSFQLQVKIISQQIESLSNTLSTHDQLLSRLAVFPLPSFPSRTHEGLLGQLLRKKVEPGVEDWINEGQLTAEGVEVEKRKGISREHLEELWDWAPSALQDSFRTYAEIFGGNYTLEERAMGIDYVKTGLKRELLDAADDSEDDEDEDDEDDTKDDIRPKSAAYVADQDSSKALPQPIMLLNDQLRFMMTGILSAPTATTTSY